MTAQENTDPEDGQRRLQPFGARVLNGIRTLVEAENTATGRASLSGSSQDEVALRLQVKTCRRHVETDDLYVEAANTVSSDDGVRAF